MTIPMKWQVLKCMNVCCMLELTACNPSGVLDNSGLRFFYTSEAPEQNAGIMFLGHAVAPIMLVPPKTERYTVSAICTADCTNQVWLRPC